MRSGCWCSGTPANGSVRPQRTSGMRARYRLRRDGLRAAGARGVDRRGRRHPARRRAVPRLVSPPERQRHARRSHRARDAQRLAGPPHPALVPAGRRGGAADPRLDRHARARAVVAARRDDGGHGHRRAGSAAVGRPDQSAGRPAQPRPPALRLGRGSGRGRADAGPRRHAHAGDRDPPQAPGDHLNPAEGVGRPDRNLALELVRVTEAAALAAARWIGRGDKIAADQAAVDAMRLVLDTVRMDGLVVIGEGEKDEAPMLYNGEGIGDGSPPQVDIAVGPLEGTELCAKGLPHAIATIALSERGTMFDPGPCVYMLKAATSRDLAHVLDLERPIGETLELMAKEKESSVGDLVVIMLDRPRHEDYMREIREAGARIRLIPHGDVSAALSAVTEGSPVDLLWGIGGTPEGVLAAAAIQCTGGQILGRLWPRSDEERQAAIDAGYDLDEVLDKDRLCGGENAFFAATGVTSGEMLQGVTYARGAAYTESISMRSRSGTVRNITARHDRAKLREITGERLV